MLELSQYTKILLAFLAIVNPIGILPLFLGLTGGFTPGERHRVARVACIAVAALLIGSVLCGQGLLILFGISINHFRVAGGILLLLIAVAMLQGRISESKHRPEEAEEASDHTAIGVVPLATPLLAGPGSLSTAIIYSGQGAWPWHPLILCCIALATALVCWVVLRIGQRLGRVLGRTGINIASRIMGLLLAAIAVEFITTGLLNLLPGLAK
ncbi:MAG: YchE family NAAT transporter [Phycisphaeraceae bacterium]